jgi:hypothetical protein
MNEKRGSDVHATDLTSRLRTTAAAQEALLEQAAAALQRARNNALEEAALIVEHYSLHHVPNEIPQDRGLAIAEDIRSRKSEP